MGQRRRRMEDQKTGPACGNVTKILLKWEELNQQLKSIPTKFKLGDVVSQIAASG